MDHDDVYTQAEEEMEADLEEAIEDFTEDFDREPKDEEIAQLKKDIGYGDIETRVEGILGSVADSYDRYDER